jgi:AcrR family transcriptional regulator
MSATPISRRDRPAKEALSRALIIETGLRILDEHGMDALTMRRVGQELDTGAASLYVYVKNRDDLLDALLDRALADVEFPPLDEGTWQQRLTSILERTIDAMARHERLALVALGSIPSSPHALAILDRMVAALSQANLDAETVSFGVDLLYLYATGAAAEQSAYRARLISGDSVDGYVRDVEAMYERLSASDYPHLAGLGPVMLSGSGDRRASWMLRVLLAGILSTPASDEPEGLGLAQ